MVSYKMQKLGNIKALLSIDEHLKNSLRLEVKKP